MGDADISIRLMTGADDDLFVAFYAALSQETLFFFSAHDPNPVKLHELVAGIPAETTIRRFAAVYPGEHGEEMAGYLFLWDLDRMVPWLGICVRDDFKGQGLGTRLMRHAQEYCRARGKGGILLTTHKENMRGQALYRKMGFEILGVDPRDELLMIFRLDDPNWRQ
jgi:ribosomal protein S18 acetylase RimI-like enzyme